MTQSKMKFLPLFTDFSIAARKCTDALVQHMSSCEPMRAENRNVLPQTSRMATGHEILEKDICIHGPDYQMASGLPEEMKSIMVELLGEHFCVLEDGEHRAFKYLINSFLAHLAICEMTFYQAKMLFQASSIEEELLDELKERAENAYAGAIKIAAKIASGERFNFFSMRVLTGETVPLRT